MKSIESSRGFLRSLFLFACAAGGLAAPAPAQVADGDLLVCDFDSSGSGIRHFTSVGTPVQSYTGGGISYEGVVVTESGLLATTARSPTSVRLFDETGVEAHSFSVPQASGVLGDLAIFADGILAVMSQSGSIELFTETGVHQGTISFPELAHPFGCYVDTEDTLWIADLDAYSNVGGIHRVDEQGNVLSTFSTGFEPGDLVRDPDGTLWVTDRQSGLVVNMDAQGAILSSFDPLVTGLFEGIALDAEGILYLAAESDSTIRKYSKAGVFQGEFPSNVNGSAVFMIIAGAGGSGMSYCFGDGTGNGCPCVNNGGSDEGCAHSGGHGAKAMGIGSTSLTDDSLRFAGSGLPAGQPALLFAGQNAVNGGAGVFFGDGLRCVGGNLTRLGVQNANASGNAEWGPGLLSGTGWTGGDVRRFQIWYRDPINSPCGSSFNLTNGVEITLQP